MRLPYIREAAILTLRNYGCQFDENDQEFKDYLETSFGKVAGSLGPNEKVTTAAKRIVALVSDKTLPIPTIYIFVCALYFDLKIKITLADFIYFATNKGNVANHVGNTAN